MRRLLAQIANLFRGRAAEREMSREIESHLALLEESFRTRGLPPEEAKVAAHRAYGGVERAKELHREARSLVWLEHIAKDVRYAVRNLARARAFTTVVVLTLALGIGANTAIFSLIDAVLLRSLPVRDPQKLVVFQWNAHNSPNTKGYYSYMSCGSSNAGTTGEHGCSFSYPMFRQFRALQDAFSSVTALGGNVGLNLRGNGPARFVHGELVSGEFFHTLGIGAALGRTFRPADDVPGAPPVAVLSNGFWQSAFGGDPAAVGRTVWLNNVPVTIVGVAPKEFPSLDPAIARPMWLPLSLQPQLGENLNGAMDGDKPSLRAGDDNWWVYLIARLKPEITLDKAQAAADAFFHNDVLDTTKKFFKSGDAPRLVLIPAPQVITGLHDRFSTLLTILMTAAALVLLVACANVAGLMLARSATRQRELAVRLALLPSLLVSASRMPFDYCEWTLLIESSEPLTLNGDCGRTRRRIESCLGLPLGARSLSERIVAWDEWIVFEGATRAHPPAKPPALAPATWSTTSRH